MDLDPACLRELRDGTVALDVFLKRSAAVVEDMPTLLLLDTAGEWGVRAGGEGDESMVSKARAWYYDPCGTPISRTTTAQSPQLSTDAPNVTRHRGFIAKSTSAGAAYGGASGAEQHSCCVGKDSVVYYYEYTKLVLT